jgi:isopenicillin-N N-acyltransferase-like protein
MGDAAIPRYFSPPAGPAERGRAFGAAQASLVANTIARYRELFAAVQQLEPPQVRRLGAQVADYLTRDWPDAAEEIAGIAAGSGTDELELFAANARTEILAGGRAPECSAIGVLPGRSATGGLLLAQNWDWHPSLAPSRVLWTIAGRGGRWLTTLTEAGLLAKIGLSSSGLGVLLNILHCSLDGGTGGLPVHVLLRLLLERCDDMADAAALIRDARLTASSCVTIGWQRGDRAELVSAELSPGGPAFVAPTADLLLHTNHFLAGPVRGGDRQAVDAPGTRGRLDDLYGQLCGIELITPARVQDALRSHRGAPTSVCCHGQQDTAFADQTATLASIVLDLGRPAMALAAGQPCTAEYADAGPRSPAAAG